MATGEELRTEISHRSRQLVSSLEDVLQALSGARLGSPSQETPLEPPGLSQLMHHAFVQYSLHQLRELPSMLLRPLAWDAMLVDAPTATIYRLAPDTEEAGIWMRGFPDFEYRVMNTIVNDRYVVLEGFGIGTQTGTLDLGEQVVMATGNPIALRDAYVVEVANGTIVQADHYYDMAGVLRQLGLIPNIVMGHDEPTPAEHAGRLDVLHPLVMHASGFLLAPAEEIRKLPSSVDMAPNLSIGTSTSVAAVANIKNCIGIHSAFVEHTPERFGELIAGDAIWIDVPTGQVLNGAVAAAHHDHGNWQTAFPDSTAEVTNLIGNKDWVVVQHRGIGTHLGPLQIAGRVFPPTGRRIEIRVLDVVQYRGGSAVLIRNYYDMCMMLLQLGLVGEVGPEA